MRARPAGLRAGLVVLAGTVVDRACWCGCAFLGRLPLSFAVVATCALGVLLLGWRGLAALVAHRVAHRVR